MRGKIFMPEDFLQLTVSFFFSAGWWVSGSLAAAMPGLTSRPCCCCCCCLFVAKKAAAAVCCPADPTRPGNFHETFFQVIWAHFLLRCFKYSPTGTRGHGCGTGLVARTSHLP